MDAFGAVKIIYSILAHPFLLRPFRNWGSRIYPGCRFKGCKNIVLHNSTIGFNGSLKSLPAGSGKGSIEISDSYIGDRAYISSGGSIKIRGSVISPGVFIGSYKHDLNPFSSKGPARDQYAIIIDEGVWIGQNVSIFGNVHIGEHAIIGACSVVLRDVPPFSMVVGNPARIIKIFDKEIQKWIPYNKG